MQSALVRRFLDRKKKYIQIKSAFSDAGIQPGFVCDKPRDFRGCFRGSVMPKTQSGGKINKVAGTHVWGSF